MAHEIEIGTDGKASFFCVGMPAWHGLGQVLEAPPTVEQGIKEAGLDWEVNLRPLMTPEGIEVPNRAVVRNTDSKVVGVVGRDYTPVQNKEAFDWFQPWLDSGMATLESAGSLNEGSRVWVLAKVVGGESEITKGDTIESFILLSNAHDGSACVRAGFSDVRVVCSNTLAMAHNDKASKLLKIRHTGKVKDALKLVQESMDLHTREFLATVEQYKTMARAGMDEETMRTYIRTVFINTEVNGDKETCKRLENMILPLFEDGIGMDLPGVRGTVWAGFNAISEYLTHHRGRTQDARVQSLWFGDSAKTLAKAKNEAMKLAMAV